MKKLLGILVLGLLFFSNANAMPKWIGKARHGYDQETQGQMAGASTASRSQPDLENISAQAGGGAVGKGAGGQL